MSYFSYCKISSSPQNRKRLQRRNRKDAKCCGFAVSPPHRKAFLRFCDSAFAGFRVFTVTRMLMLCAYCFVLSAAVPSWADQPAARSTGQQALDESAFPGLATNISLDLRGMDIVEVLKFLSTKGGLNIVTGPDVEGRATL